jgi:hypothetical protein
MRARCPQRTQGGFTELLAGSHLWRAALGPIGRSEMVNHISEPARCAIVEAARQRRRARPRAGRPARQGAGKKLRWRAVKTSGARPSCASLHRFPAPGWIAGTSARTQRGAGTLPPRVGRGYSHRRTRKPGGRWYAGNCVLEESPGSNKTGRRLTAARRKPRESATESKPPCGFSQKERVKGWGKSPPQAWQQGWQGKPRPEQDQVGGTYGLSYARVPGVSREAFSNERPRGMAARPRKGRTEPGLQAFWSTIRRGGAIADVRRASGVTHRTHGSANRQAKDRRLARRLDNRSLHRRLSWLSAARSAAISASVVAHEQTKRLEPPGQA